MPTADALPHLTPNQLNALVVLMVEARELTNTELRELAGCPLTGADNARLVTLGLVSTDRSQRPFTHELTDHGRQVARRLHTAPPPRQAGAATRALLTVLANVDRALDRLRIDPADFFGPQTSATAPGDAAPTPAGPAPDGSSSGPGDTQSLVRAAYRELAVTPGAWVSLADLRELLDEYDRSVVDAALRALARHDDVRIVPVADAGSLNPRDRAAALLIDDEENHALAIGTATDPARQAAPDASTINPAVMVTDPLFAGAGIVPPRMLVGGPGVR